MENTRCGALSTLFLPPLTNLANALLFAEMDNLTQLIQQSSIDDSSPKDQLMEMMEFAKATADIEHGGPAIPMQYINPHSVYSSLKIQREQFDRRIRDKELQIRQTFVGNEPKFSTTPLEKLKPSK